MAEAERSLNNITTLSLTISRSTRSIPELVVTPMRLPLVPLVVFFLSLVFGCLCLQDEKHIAFYPSEGAASPAPTPPTSEPPQGVKTIIGRMLKAETGLWIYWSIKVIPITSILYFLPIPIAMEKKMNYAAGVVFCLIAHDAIIKIATVLKDKDLTFPSFDKVGSVGMDSLAGSMRSFGRDGLEHVGSSVQGGMENVAKSGRFGVISFSSGALIALAVVSLLQGQWALKVKCDFLAVDIAQL